jgi:hypothetical protein
MPASYKLRLSDGTLLVVDHDGLSTWVVDHKAMVQLVGSTHWRPLKAFLAAERAAARNASRQASGAAPALPLIPPPPRKEETPPSAEPPPRSPAANASRQTSSAAPALPLIPPPPRREETPPSAEPPPSEPATNASRPTSSAAPALPLIPPPPRKEETPPSAEPLPDDPEPFFVDEPPAVQVRPESVDGPAKEGADATWSADASRRLEEVLPEEPAPSAPVEPPFLGEPPVAQTLAEEPVVRGVESVSPQPSPNEHDAPIRLKPADDEVHGRPPASPWQEPRERRSTERPPSLLVLADDVAGPGSGHEPQPSAADDGPPIIRLKPRDDWDEAPDSPGPAVYEDPPWRDPRDEKLFRAFAAVGGFLSVWLGRLDRQLRRLPSIRPERLAPPPGLRDGAQRLVAGVGGLLSRWMDRLRQEPRRPPPVSPEGPAPKASRTSDRGEASPPVGPPPRLQVLAEEPSEFRDGFTRDRATPDPTLPNEPFRPPPPISELPILRLADVDEPQATSEVYEGDRWIHIAWRWTKRIVVVGGILAGGMFAALTWEIWVPKAERLSRILFAEIDEHMRSRDQTERRKRALQEATEQLPYLSPETIELVLSGGALDLPDVFRLASDATDRGLSALTPEEAQEWKALRQQMVDSLRPDERQRALEYDRARGRRPTLPFEDREALELLARGARGLPPASRVRLQVLSGQAIAAGLARDPSTRPRRPEGD